MGSQLSRPYQIALIGIVALALVWFFALRPKGDSESGSSASAPTPAPKEATPKAATPKPATPYGRAVSKAKGASAASDASNQRLQAGSAQASNAPRVLVLLFWNKAATDDRAVRANLAQVNRHDGRVAIAAAPVQDVGRYGPITSGVKVLESPTVIVLDTRSRKARTITGYADVRELDQSVAESLRAG